MSAEDTNERVRLLAKLGAGGMADVFLGLQVGEREFSRFVVVKKIHARHIDDDQALGMFFDEARTIAQLNHPHVVKIFDFQRLAKEVCLTMEYVDGEALSYVMTRLRSGGRQFPPSIVCKLILDALDALHYAHEAKANDGTPLQLVHRDISPQNLMLDQNGYVKVIDFGIAKTAIQTELTSPGGIKGKVTYLAPESFTERNIDRRVDIYALGIVLWECLTLRKALALRDAPMQEVMDAVCNLSLDPPSAHNDQISAGIDAVVAKAVATDRAQRYATCADFARDLRKVALESVGIASANDVATWFQTTFAARLAKRKSFEQEALVRMAEDDAKKAAEADEDSLPTAAGLTGDAQASIPGRTDRRLAEVVGPEETAEKNRTATGSADVRRDATPATFVSGGHTMTAQLAQPKNPYLFLGFLFFLFIVGAVVLRFLFFSDSVDPTTTATNVVVRSDPSGAEVFIDDRSRGRTSAAGLALALPTDVAVELMLKREGYAPFSETIRPRADAVIQVLANLVPAGEGDGRANAQEPVAPANEEQAKADLVEEMAEDAGDSRVRPSGPRVATSKEGRRTRSRTRSRSRGRSSTTDSAPAKPAAPKAVNEPDPPPTVVTPPPAIEEPPKAPSPKAKTPPVVEVSEPDPVPPPAPPRPAPPKKEERNWYSKTGDWSGPTVLRRGCGRCHGKTAPALVLKKKTKRQWQRFFSRDQHDRHGKLDLVLSSGEQKRALATILQRIEDDRSFGLAGDR